MPMAWSWADQTRHGHLTLVVLDQHKAAQLRPEMADDPGRHRGRDRSGRPGSASARGGGGSRGAQHQVLNQEVLVALEARAGGSRRDDPLLVDGEPLGLAALPPGLEACRPAGIVPWSMPLGLPGLIVGRPLRFLRRAISSRWAAASRSSSATRPNSSSTNRFRSAFDRPSRSGAGDMQGIESELSLRRNPDPAAQPGLLPMLLSI